MFVALGAGAAWFGDALLSHRRPLEVVAGVFVVLAGLMYAGAPLPRPLLAERRARIGPAGGTFAPGLAGVAFALAWTPCLGPTLAAILALAAGSGGATEGAALLGIYALGVGVPFLVFGLAFTRALGLVRGLRRHWRLVSVGSGSLLVAFGLLLATGQLARLTTQLATYTGFAI
jgi:cytochrome c-type biogenesis protein